MILFPNCKINLGLNILRKREDGFHDLETVFYPLQIRDALEVIQGTRNKEQGTRNKEQGARNKEQGARNKEQGARNKEQEARSKEQGASIQHPTSNLQPPTSPIHFSSTGLPINGDPSINLCVKAYHLLKKDFPQLPAVQMHLHKVIPMGAGLGGGSADGAFTLKLLNSKFNLNLSTHQLLTYALQLGSDCPFFIRNQPCFAGGRGEIMTGIELDLAGYQFVVVNPGIHVNTAWAFSHIAPSIPKKSIQQIIQQPIATWKNELVNDFELAVAQEHPAIGNIKERLYAAGAVYASMSGSGSTLFGVFKKEAVPLLDFPSAYFTMMV